MHLQKTIILLLAMNLPLNAITQSKYGYEVGLDSNAVKFNIKTKSTFYIGYGENTIDTGDVEKTSYDTNGYISRFENRGHDVHFSYNADGYLVDENWHIRGPFANGYREDTTYRTETFVYEDFGTVSRIKEEFYFHADPEEKFGHKSIYNYDTLGRISTVHNYRIDDVDTVLTVSNYFYDEQNLLVKVKSQDETFISEYFYDKNLLLIERKRTNNGVVYLRQIIIYEYY